MISGHIEAVVNDTNPFQNILSAHPRHVEIGTVETDKVRACLVVEKDALKKSIAERFWGQKLPQDQYDTLKKEMADWSLQSVIIERSKTDSHLEITRNQEATCGIYLLAKGNTLYFHWDPVELYPHLDTSDLLDTNVSIAFLEMQYRYGTHTVFKNICLLPERGHAVFKNKKVKIIRPPHLDSPKAVPLKEGADPVAMFHDLVRKVISRWPIETEHVGSILSTGLDTTIVAHMLQEKITPHRLRSFGYSMMGEQRDAIKSMRMETVRKLDLDDYYPPVETNIDEAHSLKIEKWWPEQTTTSFAEINLARRMSVLGITLVTTGIGGDELCMLSDEERVALAVRPPESNEWAGDTYESFCFISERFKSQVLPIDDFLWPDGYVGISAPSMANGVDLSYLRQGIWVVHPLSLAELQTFAHFLPTEWRRKRRLSREALIKLGYSESFIKQNPKEDLTTTLWAAMLRVDWEKMFRKSSVLCDLGLINRERLFEGIEIFKKTSSVAIGIKLVRVLNLELSLQSVHGNRPLAKTA